MSVSTSVAQMPLVERRTRPSTVVTVARDVLSTGKGRVGLALVGIVLAIAAFGPLVAPHSPTAFIIPAFSPPSSTAPLGGDVLGRDVLSRLLDGGRLLLLTAAAATILGVGVGTILGVVAAYFGGVRESVIMRAVDVLLAFPQLVFALLLVSLVGPQLWLVIVAVGISHAPQVARVMRGAALDVIERDFVRAAELNGTPTRRILTRTLLPNLLAPLMVESGLRLSYSIVIIAGLSFLGLGQAPPAPNWGIMISENRIGVAANPWGVLAPVIVIAMLTIGMNVLTDSIAQVALGEEGSEKQLLMETIGDAE
jgi:peptide/nickel transport system permease protein